MRRVGAVSLLRVLLGAALLVLAGVQDVRAQGFFESLFGGGQPKPAEVPQRSLPPPGYHTPLAAPARERGEPREEAAGKDGVGSGRYRTLCVRMCDGYYFPISQATTRSGFYKDAKLCKASCGEDAKLYHLDKHETDVHGMTDASGRPYSRLQTAFLYRKRMVEGCRCKPDPWAQSEVDRHRAYASAGAGGHGEAKPKQAPGPSDPAVRTVFDRLAKDGASMPPAESEAVTTETATVEAVAPANAAEWKTPVPADDKNGPGSAGSAPKPEPAKPAANPKPPAERPQRKSPTLADEQKTRVQPQPVRTSPTQSGPLWGLGGGSGNRWPGE